MMNQRDCALAAMRGQPVDYIPFIARMELWFYYHRNRGTLPPAYRQATLYEMARDMGIGVTGMGAGAVPYYTLAYHDVEVVSHHETDANRGVHTVTE